jgi:hypothetical protein
MAATVRERKKAGESDIDLRNSMWPDAEQRMWPRKGNQGFTTIPKTMPLILRIMDEMSKNHPLSSTYLALWCRTWDNGFVRLHKVEDMAFAAGFSGQRGERTWRDRLKRLAELGFVELQAGANGRLAYAFLPNPHAVILQHRDARTPGLSEATYNTFLERALDMGAKDMQSLLDARKPPAAPKASVKAVRPTSSILKRTVDGIKQTPRRTKVV